jgi:hypothetical protein
VTEKTAGTGGGAIDLRECLNLKLVVTDYTNIVR